jgi:hypothetical protein
MTNGNRKVSEGVKLFLQQRADSGKGEAVYHCIDCGSYNIEDQLAAPQAECAPRSPYGAPFTTDVEQCCGDPSTCNDPCEPPNAQAECAPREAQPNWKALHAAADAVAASADIWAGFSTQDAKVCVDAYLAAPAPERADAVLEKLQELTMAAVEMRDTVEAFYAERVQESAGVLTDDQIREIWMRETGTKEQYLPFAILDFARAVLAKKEGA